MEISVLGKRWVSRVLACLVAMTATQAAYADTLTVMWDRSSDSTVAGYLVYVGTQSGVYGATYDVGNTTSFSYSNATAGQPYYFAVAAYYPGPVVGARSTEVAGTTNSAPVLVNPGNQSTPVGTSVSLQLSGSDPGGQAVSYGVTALPPGLALTTATGRISGTPTTAGSYLVTAVVSDGVLSDSETFTWTITEVTSPTPTNPTPTNPSDFTAPIIRITVPTPRGSYNSGTSFLTIGGMAADNIGVTEVTWSSSRGGGGLATGTDNWIAGVPIQRGENTITVRARDAAGNVSSASITVKLTGKGK